MIKQNIPQQYLQNSGDRLLGKHAVVFSQVAQTESVSLFQKLIVKSITPALLFVSIISSTSSNICMSQNEHANSPYHFRAQKNHLLVEISLQKHQTNPLIVIAIRNNTTNMMFILQMDTIQITRDKVLGNIFRRPQELYQELVSGFEQIKIEETPKYLLIKYEVKVGKFRTEPITLQLKQQSKSNKQKDRVSLSTLNAKRKIFIDKSYVRDFNQFKENFNKVCEKITHKEVLGRLNMKNDRNSRLKIKNMFITFSNSILKTYRKNVEFADIEITQEECFTEPANKLLAQKNELLQNILLKAMKRIRETPTQPIEIDFMPQIPTQLLVVLQNGQQVPLERYLLSLPKQQIQSRIRYHQKRRERISNSFNLINQLKKQRGEQMSRILQRSEAERRSQRVSLGNRANLSDTNDYDEF